jgi:rare lipoprotein A
MPIRFFLLLAFLLLALTSCSTARYKALPEATSGKTYAVASWYGKDFHGKPTSSGEIFDMYSNTCAHKEYPFGTKLKVTHTTTNKSVTCLVNDRGPFIEGRDIDLSYASAKDIGLIGPGVSPVLLEVEGRDDSYIKRVKVQSVEKTGPFSIQIGSFTEGINAVRLKTGLDLKYNNVYIQEVDLKGTTYYRVRIGNFDNFNNALSTAEQLAQEGYQSIILKAEVKI